MKAIYLFVTPIFLFGCGQYHDLKCKAFEGSSDYSVSVEEGDEPVFSWTGGNANYLGVYDEADKIWQVRGVEEEGEFDNNNLVSPITFGDEEITGGKVDYEDGELESGKTYNVLIGWGCKQGNGNSGRDVDTDFDMP